MEVGKKNNNMGKFDTCDLFLSGTKLHPKELGLAQISLRTSGQKLGSGPPNPEKQALWHRHAVRTSMKNFGLINFGLIVLSLFLSVSSSMEFL